MLRLDQYPVAAIWRMGIGFLMPVASKYLPVPFPIFFLAILLALRIGPAILRRLMPVSGAVKEEWARRRQLAKNFDSYQWQKLFWIGLGMLLAPKSAFSEWVIVWLCLAGGALGLIFWFRRASAMRAIPA